MVKPFGIFMGSAFLFGGLLGFVPGVVKDGMYFGIFMVNTAHNVLHIASGAMLLTVSLMGAGVARLGFQVFGLLYAAMAVVGLKMGDGMIFGLISNNRYDAAGHAVLALLLLLIGFATPKISRLAHFQ